VRHRQTTTAVHVCYQLARWQYATSIMVTCPDSGPGFCEIVEENVRRLTEHAEAPPDFDGIILCRPHPRLPAETYRVVEGTKRAIAVRVARLRNLRVPALHSYFGDHIQS
jgi:hypothetical protein